MLFKLRELITLLVIGALLVVITTGALVRERLQNGGAIAPTLTTAAIVLAEVPEDLLVWVSLIGKPGYKIHDRFPKQAGFVGGTDRDERYLLLNRRDEEIEKSVVELIDLRSFQVLHRWEPGFDTDTLGFGKAELSYREIYPFYSDVLENKATHSLLTPQGNLVVGRDGHIGKFNVCSNLLWNASLEEGAPTNASLELDGQGNIWVTAALSVIPSLGQDVEIGDPTWVPPSYLDNLIVQISPSGEVIFSKSIADILAENRLAQFVVRFNFPPTPDFFHLVDIQPALSDGTHWQRGDLLISLKHISLVLLYRPSTDSVLWHSIGRTEFQSDVDFVDESSIAIFDNNTPVYLKKNAIYGQHRDLKFKVVNGHNKVLVYDFASDQYSHHLIDSLRTNEVKTASRGRNQILPNGDLFVEESDFGRLLYFKSDGSLLWSYVNRTEDGAYALGSSRILYRDQDIDMVQDFLAQKDKRLDECR